jgi:hypothetical protein
MVYALYTEENGGHRSLGNEKGLLAKGDPFSLKSYVKAESSSLIGADSAVIKKGFSKSRQEDTHEFFRFVTDALQNTALCGLPKYVTP